MENKSLWACFFGQRFGSALPVLQEHLRQNGEHEMITGGNATVYVSDMDRAVSFYVNVLGLKLKQRFGSHLAEIKVGENLVIGLHPISEKTPAPGTSGAISIGLMIDEPVDPVVQRLCA